MAFSLNHNTLVITIPQSDLTFVSGTLYELDTDAFRRELKSYEDSAIGMPLLDTHSHNTEVTIAGVTYARLIEIINGYTVEFEDGQYAVRLVGSNNNIFDEGIISRNQVSVIPTNSAGLQIVTSGTAAPPEAHISASFAGTTVTMTVWLTRDGAPVSAGLTTTTVNWYNPDGTLLFTDTGVTFDARGVAELSATATLVSNTAYYATVSITDGTGTVVDLRGVPTGS